MNRNQVPGKLALCVTAAVVIVAGSRARAGFTSGSDGSDGSLDCAWLSAHDDHDDYPDNFDCGACTAAPNPDDPNLPGPCTFVVDLSKALPLNGDTTKWDTLDLDTDTDNDGFGDGVYDPKQWAVVYKFTTINIPSNVIVKFKNHPSGAPVAWLAQGDVAIHGWVNLNGEHAHEVHQWPAFSEPGPGGFSGGAPADPTSLIGSIGFGPGSATNYTQGNLPDACHNGKETWGALTYCNHGRVYGVPEAFPLMGGSGGGVLGGSTYVNAHRPYVVAGAGGGAILIASDSEIFLPLGSQITAVGGSGFCVCSYNEPDLRQQAGAGSGGSIRLVAGLRLSGQPYVSAGGQGWPGCCREVSGDGWVRYEAPEIADTYSVGPFGATSSFIPGEVFPGSDAPTLEVLNIGNVPAPADPLAGPATTELELDTDQASQIVIRATNIPALTRVKVRVVPVLGNEILIESTQLQAQPDGSLRATASVVFPPGRSEIQLRANWTP